MVVATMHWFSATKKPLPTTQSTIGILAFDTAKTMSRLVSLYNSLSDDEISKLMNETIRSNGVAYLNSSDEKFLLNLAISERLEDLNQAAISVSHLSQRCSDCGLNRFDLVYSDTKQGTTGVRNLEFGTKEITKLLEKMEKLISSTAHLYSAMDSLSKIEASSYKSYKSDCLEKNLVSKRKEVKLFQETSLWNQTFDKTVGLMARLVCIIYARIFTVFGPYVSGNLHHIRIHQPESNYFLLADKNKYKNKQVRRDKGRKQTSKSGPIEEPVEKKLVRFPSGIPNLIIPDDDVFSGCEAGKNNRVYRLAPPSTVGGSGLTFRYAHIVLLAERCLDAPMSIGGDARKALYEMLPLSVKMKVRAKLRSYRMKKEEWSNGGGETLAEGWRKAVEEIMGWLGPMGHDTMRWQTERNLEKQKFDTRCTTLLFQTLHYSDLEKIEAAIVEVLVGLSCIFWHENRFPRSHARWLI